MRNENLIKAKKEKNDEFYTRIEDIEKELRHYGKHFWGKAVYCNCDDPFESNFFLYFVLNFKSLGLKRLIATCYGTSAIAGRQLSIFDFADESVPKDERKAYYIDIDHSLGDLVGGMDAVKPILLREGLVRELKGDGDFRSEECVRLLKEADVVCTNPPFSLFREYVEQLMKEEKKFLIIGNENAITYKEIFPLIKENKLWLGYGHVKEFVKPSGETQKFGNVLWFTNLEHNKRSEPYFLCAKYSPEKYSKYDNYDAIEVGKVENIPCDYDGVMGVPISFLDKYCPEQFEILSEMTGVKADCFVNGDDGNLKFTINNKGVYARILIRRR